MLFAVTPSRDMLRANLFPRIRPSDRVWAGAADVSSMRTGNVPGLGGVHCSNVTVRRCRGKRTPRLFVATILFSTFSVPRTSLNMWSKGFVTVKARLTGCGPEGAEAAVMAWDVEDMVPCGPVPPPLV